MTGTEMEEMTRAQDVQSSGPRQRASRCIKQDKLLLDQVVLRKIEHEKIDTSEHSLAS